jgi:hypothetical protein
MNQSPKGILMASPQTRLSSNLHAGPLLLFTLLMLLVGSSGPALAAANLENSVGLRFGTFHFENGSASEPELRTSHSPVRGITIGTRWNRLSLELSADWLKANYEQTWITAFAVLPILVVGTVEQVNRTLIVIPILLTGQVHLLAEPGPVDPYLGVGGGYYRILPRSLTLVSNQGIEAEIDDTFGFHVGLGVNIKASRVIAFSIDTRYAVAKTNIHFKSSIGSLTPDSETLHLNGFVTTFGIKYYFTK